MKICSICGSDKKVCRFKNGELYCNKHYNQMYKSGYCTFENKKKRENTVKELGDTLVIATVRGEEILIDKEDYNLIKDFYWSLNSQGYAISVINGKHKRLHKIIMNNTKQIIDHINGNKLDNRKSNLRICTAWQNAVNTSVSKNNKTGILGVSILKNGKYRARIMFKGKEIRLGHYDRIEDAAEARKNAEIKYFGYFSPAISRG